MNSAASIFGFGVTVRNALYNRGIFKTRSLRGPVISVGNISVGGSGKTPFVMALGELLQCRSITFDVLSRGYARNTRGVALVDPAGAAQDFGDEPLLIARRLNVPVIVGGDRYEAGVFAEKQFGPQMHLLDDGFQHRALARDFDIVLITQADLSDRLLPSGRLREQKESLRRADALVLMNGVSAESIPVSGPMAWKAVRGIRADKLPSRPIVFCGIARPKLFVSQLRNSGVIPIGEMFYRDHYAYSKNDIRHLLDLKDKVGANGFVTTEKDAVNLGASASFLTPLSVVAATLELLDADNAVDSMLRTITQRRQRT